MTLDDLLRAIQKAEKAALPSLIEQFRVAQRAAFDVDRNSPVGLLASHLRVVLERRLRGLPAKGSPV